MALVDDSDLAAAFLRSALDGGLADARNEPARVRSDLAAVAAEKQALAEAHFRSFLRFSGATHAAVPAFARAEKALHRTPALLDAAEAELRALSPSLLLPGPFPSAVSRPFPAAPSPGPGAGPAAAPSPSASSSAAAGEQLARREEDLRDLLELPRVLETCARSDLHDEALALHRAAVRWARAYPECALLADVANRAERHVARLVRALERALEAEPTLAEALRVVDLLRRTGHFDARAAARGVPAAQLLRARFLALRDVALRRRDPAWVLAGAPKTLRSAEAYRQHVLLVAAHYRAAFGDDAAAAGAAAGVDAPWLRWANAAVSRFLAGLCCTLDHVDSVEDFAQWLDQATLFSQAVSSAGMDFWPLALPLFDDCYRALLEKQLAVARVRFQYMVRSERWVVAVPSATSASGADSGVDGGDEYAAPPPLIRFAPLAHGTNGLLLALNDVQRCLPRHLQRVVVARLGRYVTDLAHDAVALRGELTLGDDSSGADAYSRMARDMRDIFLPYAARCLARLARPDAAPALDDAAEALSSLLPALPVASTLPNANV